MPEAPHPMPAAHRSTAGGTCTTHEAALSAACRLLDLTCACLLSLTLHCRLQSVAAQCTAGHGTEVEVLPLDLCAPYAELHAAAVAADAAFDGAGVDYLVHNAGAWGVPAAPMAVLCGPVQVVVP